MRLIASKDLTKTKDLSFNIRTSDQLCNWVALSEAQLQSFEAASWARVFSVVFTCSLENPKTIIWKTEVPFLT